MTGKSRVPCLGTILFFFSLIESRQNNGFLSYLGCFCSSRHPSAWCAYASVIQSCSLLLFLSYFECPPTYMHADDFNGSLLRYVKYWGSKTQSCRDSSRCLILVSFPRSFHPCPTRPLHITRVCPSRVSSAQMNQSV